MSWQDFATRVMSDPVFFSLGVFEIRWYALSYILGLVLGFLYIGVLAKRQGFAPSPEWRDKLLLYVTIGIIIGGRLGYVLFYHFSFYLSHPLEAFMIWQGGMSFHGGLFGASLGVFFCARRLSVPFLPIMDFVAAAAPIGLFFGRIANFINGELWGRISDAPWAIIFPMADEHPRHPSQLYEAGAEGLLLFLILWLIIARGGLAIRGLISGLFLCLYSLARFAIELVREPDSHLGFLFGEATMGMVLCLPMLVLGILVLCYGAKRRNG